MFKYFTPETIKTIFIATGVVIFAFAFILILPPAIDLPDLSLKNDETFTLSPQTEPQPEETIESAEEPTEDFIDFTSFDYDIDDIYDIYDITEEDPFDTDISEEITAPEETAEPKPPPDFTGKHAKLDKLIYQYCYGEGVSVFYKDLTDGDAYFYNAEQRYFIASLIKAPYVVYVYKSIMAMGDDYNPNQKYTYLESDYREGTGKIKNMEYGVSFTIDELISYAIRWSDNVAMDKLRKLFPVSGFTEYAAKIGLPHTWDILSAVNGRICAQCAAVYLEDIYQFIEENNPYSQILKDHMLHTINKMIYAGHPFARKYGWAEDSFHDMGIVYNPERPYLIAILSNRAGNAGDLAMFRTISLAIEDYHDNKKFEDDDEEEEEEIAVVEEIEEIDKIDEIDEIDKIDKIEEIEETVEKIEITYDLYYNADKEFMLDYPAVDENNDFPVFGFYLIDMNFDKIPELAVRRHSGGSMGGYFLYYYFDGEEVKPVLNSDGEPARSIDNDWARLLADFENNKAYLLKEMGALSGNENLTYGYVREITVDENGDLYINHLLALDVDWTMPGYDPEKDYPTENEYLSDKELDPCIKTKKFAEDSWQDIPSEEYLEIKLRFIPEDNEYIDLFETEVYCLLYYYPRAIGDEPESYRQITEEEINALFDAWLESLQPHEDEELDLR